MCHLRQNKHWFYRKILSVQKTKKSRGWERWEERSSTFLIEISEVRSRYGRISKRIQSHPRLGVVPTSASRLIIFKIGNITTNERGNLWPLPVVSRRRIFPSVPKTARPRPAETIGTFTDQRPREHSKQSVTTLKQTATKLSASGWAFQWSF